MTLAPYRQQLDQRGYVLLPRLLEAAQLGRLRERVRRLYETEGDLAGAEFKQEPGARRLANLINKGRVFQELVVHSEILPLVSHILGERVKLSSLNARSASPHGNTPQPLHCDMSALPDEHGPWVCNTVWLLDEFTPENGALRVVPGSHRWQRLPQDVLADPTADHPQQTLISAPAGSAIVINAHLWHGGMVNRTAAPRVAVHAFYCRRDKPQQQYQKQMLDDSLQQTFASPLRDLLALDDPLNDRLCQQNVVKSGFLR